MRVVEGAVPRAALRASAHCKCTLDLLLETKGNAVNKRRPRRRAQSATGHWVAKSPPEGSAVRGCSPGGLPLLGLNHAPRLAIEALFDSELITRLH